MIDDTSYIKCEIYVCCRCLCCHKFVLKGHLCYLRRLERKKTSGKFLFFDTECDQDEKVECEEGYRPMYLQKENCLECKAQVSGKQCQRCWCENCDYLKPLELHCTQCSRCECRQTWCGRQQHVANYILSQSVCNACEDQEFHPLAKCSQVRFICITVYI